MRREVTPAADHDSLLHRAPETLANERFKGFHRVRFWASLSTAVFVHCAVFVLWPTMEVRAAADRSSSPELVRVEEHIRLPDAPERIERPARPVISEIPIDPAVTIARTDVPPTYDPGLPMRPARVRPDSGQGPPSFVPMDVPPRLDNRAEVERALRERYPPVLRDAGVEGTVRLRFWVETDGSITRIEVAASSGYPGMDRAALEIAPLLRFTPALLRDRPVAVPVTLPLTFRVRREDRPWERAPATV